MHLFTRKDLVKSQFYSQNRNILEQKRGAGFWLWKYYFIDKVLNEIEEGDILIYCDSAILFRKSVKPLIKLAAGATNGVLLFYNAFYNSQFTKRDVFVELNCDNDLFYNSPQIAAQFQVFIKNDFSVNFVKDVLNVSVKDNLINDDPNVLGFENLDSFIDHRHDQSITSLMAHKRKICLFPDPSQFRTKNTVYCFPDEKPYEGIDYKNTIFVHRLSGINLLKLPLKFFK